MSSIAGSLSSLAKRRWLPRFGLKTLLLLVTLFGCGFGYLGHLYRRVAHQRYIVRKIQEAGGEVRYDWQLGMGKRFDPNFNTDFLTFSTLDPKDLYLPANLKLGGPPVAINKPPGPRLIQLLLGNDVYTHVEEVNFLTFSHPATPLDPRDLWQLPQLRMLILVGPQISDEWLDCVAKAPELQVLLLFGGPDSTATADGLSRLKVARNLQSLALQSEFLNDKTLEGVVCLRQLKVLSVDASNVTSAMLAKLGDLAALRELIIKHAKNINFQAIEPISRLQSLRSLRLINVAVPDTVLAKIGTIRQLERLDLTQSQISSEGLLELRRLAKLKELIGLNTTREAAIELHRLLPDCRISGTDTKNRFLLEPDGKQ